MMKKLLLNSALLVVFSAPALAADSETEMPAEPPPSVEQQEAVSAELGITREEAIILDGPVAGDIIVEPEASTDEQKQEPTQERPSEAVQPSWGYTGTGAAPYWATINESYALCASGEKQSPINIAKFLQEDMQDIMPAYEAVPLSVLNDGYTIQMNFENGGGFQVGASHYQLEHAVFRTPSEHYLDGAPYPMEVEFIHHADDGAVAIVSTMVKLGEHNPVIEGIWQNVPIRAGGSKTVDTVELSATDLLPSSLDYYHYEGSLTVPPCTEGVGWYVLKEPIEVSEKQLRAFQALFPVNARPVQALNDRVIVGD